MARVIAMTAVAVAAAVFPMACVQAQPDSVRTEGGAVAVDTLAKGLVHPWGMDILPDGRLLVTERPGRLRVVGRDGTLSAPLGGTPEVFSEGQGGLLDVAIDPDFRSNRTVYLSFAEPGEGGASTALGRGRLEDGRIEGFEVIFRQQPKVSGGAHFGGRIVFAPDGNLFLTMGERFKFDPAQDLSNHLGTVAHIRPDGSVPEGNPFANRAGAKPEIWSYGHRNVEAAAIDPATGDLWVVEMGPRGGDELNRAEAGRNYGWPVVSWGQHYDGRDIPDPPTRPEFADAVRHWTPVISPSGMAFYRGDMFPAWKGSALVGGLTAKAIVRLAIADGAVTGEERIPLDARIRDVAEAPDGAVYALTDADDGRVLRLSAQPRAEGSSR